jgi:hypothetical protein
MSARSVTRDVRRQRFDLPRVTRKKDLDKAKPLLKTHVAPMLAADATEFR